MDCETCNDLLLDLAYGELDEVRAAAVRKHADACVECRDALRRITRGRALARRFVPAEAPPVSATLQAAIASHAAAATTNGHVPPGASVVEIAGPRGRLARWAERVGEVAMRRQVAMAAVFLLMLGVGLVFYQSHPRPTDAQDDRTPDVVPAVEVSGGTQARVPPGIPVPPPLRRSTVAAAPAPAARAVAQGEREDRARQAAAGGGASADDGLGSAAEPGAASAFGSPSVAAGTGNSEAQGPSAGSAFAQAPLAQAPAVVVPPPPAVAAIEPRGQLAAGASSADAAANRPTPPPWLALAESGRAAAARNDLALAANQFRAAIAQAPDVATRNALSSELAQVQARSTAAAAANAAPSDMALSPATPSGPRGLGETETVATSRTAAGRTRPPAAARPRRAAPLPTSGFSRSSTSNAW